MNKESVGKLFKSNFGTYECVAYSDKPSVVMKNTITGESVCVVIDSDYAKKFEVIEEDKKIEKLEIYYDDDLEEYIVETYINGVNYKEIFKSKYNEMMINKINEIIDVLNDMREDK